MHTDPPPDLLEHLSRQDGMPGTIQAVEPVTGGDTHGALRIRTGQGDWFVKWGDRDALPQFEAERRGLEALAESGGPRVPRALATGAKDRLAWLVTEYLPLQRAGDAGALGRDLAAMHRVFDDAHGFEADNFIGPTPQCNGRSASWPDFWWRNRLAPQLQLAAQRGFAGHTAPLAERLERASHALLVHDPAPSLLHGDLWSGNHAYLGDGTPVIFDPACWFGDRETDLAMMRLFGGFDPEVFRVYADAWPLPADHERRRGLYQLYHVLNHLNLFGAGWLGRFESLATEVLAAAGLE